MMKNLNLYSDPKTVYKLAHYIYGPDVEIKESTRKDKKYMMKNPFTNRWVHFGQYGYEDYTRHKNLSRRLAFRTRNRSWANENPFSPAFLSYYLLW